MEGMKNDTSESHSSRKNVQTQGQQFQLQGIFGVRKSENFLDVEASLGVHCCFGGWVGLVRPCRKFLRQPKVLLFTVTKNLSGFFGRVSGHGGLYSSKHGSTLIFSSNTFSLCFDLPLVPRSCSNLYLNFRRPFYYLGFSRFSIKRLTRVYAVNPVCSGVRCEKRLWKCATV